MLTEQEIQQEIARVVLARDESRIELVANVSSHPDLFHALCLKQALIVGKLGGLYIALGKSPDLINQMLTDPYWQGLTTERRQIDPELE